MRTTSTRAAKASEVQHGWVVIDAEGVIVGRLASFIALRLRGKHRADFTPNVDTGDHVVVINAEKVALTGKKLTDKIYYRHTGYPGGIKERVAGKVLAGKHPERVLEKAVERMLPKESPLARQQFSKLHIYAGPEHPHAAQQPVSIDFKSKNRKNAKVA
ncbi:MAG TPA: 50S ribosomal protein L13 [Terricaulis sp.]|jgi:ribosomal protein L13, bacterial type|nr:50S ribosomal protein L13 [Terricaulis sp.]